MITKTYWIFNQHSYHPGMTWKWREEPESQRLREVKKQLKWMLIPIFMITTQIQKSHPSNHLYYSFRSIICRKQEGAIIIVFSPNARSLDAEWLTPSVITFPNGKRRQKQLKRLKQTFLVCLRILNEYWWNCSTKDKRVRRKASYTWLYDN